MRKFNISSTEFCVSSHNGRKSLTISDGAVCCKLNQLTEDHLSKIGAFIKHLALGLKGNRKFNISNVIEIEAEFCQEDNSVTLFFKNENFEFSFFGPLQKISSVGEFLIK